MGLFSSKKKILDYEIGFDGNVAWVRIKNCDLDFSNQELIKFWAYYFSKIMFNLHQKNQEEQELLIEFLKVINNNWTSDYVDCMKISTIDSRMQYSQKSSNSDVLLKGSFYKTNGVNTLKTKFPLNVRMHHIITSVIATLQYVQDKCLNNEDDHIVLHKTLENMLHIYNHDQSTFDEVSSTVSVPIVAFDEALKELFYNQPPSEEMSLDDNNIDNKLVANNAIDLADKLEKQSVSSTLDTYMALKKVEEVENDELFKKIKLETIAAIIHYIDRKAYIYLSPDDRSYFMDLLISSSIENYIERSDVKDLKEEKIELKDDFTEYINNAMLNYGKYKKIMISEHDDNNELINTLIWNIGKNIASLEDLQADADMVYQCINIFIEHLSYLSIDERMNFIHERIYAE